MRAGSAARTGSQTRRRAVAVASAGGGAGVVVVPCGGVPSVDVVERRDLRDRAEPDPLSACAREHERDRVVPNGRVLDDGLVVREARGGVGERVGFRVQHVRRRPLGALDLPHDVLVILPCGRRGPLDRAVTLARPVGRRGGRPLAPQPLRRLVALGPRHREGPRRGGAPPLEVRVEAPGGGPRAVGEPVDEGSRATRLEVAEELRFVAASRRDLHPDLEKLREQGARPDPVGVREPPEHAGEHASPALDRLERTLFEAQGQPRPGEADALLQDDRLEAEACRALQHDAVGLGGLLAATEPLLGDRVVAEGEQFALGVALGREDRRGGDRVQVRLVPPALAQADLAEVLLRVAGLAEVPERRELGLEGGERHRRSVVLLGEEVGDGERGAGDGAVAGALLLDPRSPLRVGPCRRREDRFAVEDREGRACGRARARRRRAD